MHDSSRLTNQLGILAAAFVMVIGCGESKVSESSATSTASSTTAGSGVGGQGGASAGSGQGGKAASSSSVGGQVGSGGTGGKGGAGGSVGICGEPLPVNGLSFCGGSASASSGMGAMCMTSYCDGQMNAYEAHCTTTPSGTSCSCQYNNKEMCTCKTASQSCSNCCPGPWQGLGGGGAGGNGGAGGVMTVSVVAVTATSGGN